MSTETGTDDDVREDAELIAAVRGGDPEATGELYQRHAGAALVVARRYTNSTADAEDVVSDAFAATFLALQRGNGPDVAFRAYLFTVVRRVAGLQRDRARRMEPTDDVASLETGTAWAGTAEEPALEGFERGVVARAFHTLPERWQAVLWHTEVEGLPPAQIAPILGLTANGVAALAYRAREGLRQAYLQMHLNDPLDEGCRSAAGKLGSYVRGGLGTRETAQVEAHLDGCGECRALVLELGDVNHGMRAVIAPLVLGLAGMGALAHLLPVGGGIAAGAAVLAGHGQAGGAAGAAGTGGAAAAGAGGAAATVGGGAAGVGGAATATAGGFAAFIASIPAAAVAVAAGVVVLAGVATAGVMGLLSGPDQPAAIPTASVTSTLDQPGELSTDPAAPAPVPSTQPTDPVAGPTVPPTPGTAVPPTSAPTSAPTTAPTAAPTSVPTSEPTSAPTSDPTSDSTAPPTTAPTAEPPPAPTAEPTTEPTPEPTTEPSSEPTQEPTSAPTEPPVAPAALSVVLPDAGQLELDAGADSQELTITVANTGGTAASNLTARVDLPDGVAFDSVRTLMGGAGAGFAAPVSSGWTCTSGGEDDRVVLCTLDSLAPSSSQAMVLRVSIGEAYDAGDGSITLSVSGTGLDYRPDPIPVHVRPSPARVTVDLPTKPVTLVRGRTVPVVLAVRNAGGSAVGAAGADAQVTLPLGARWTPADSDWTCHATGENADPVVLACHLPALAAWTSAPLTVDVTAGTSSSGPIAVLLTPSGRSAPTAVGVGYAVVDPARLTVSGDAGVDVRAGRTTAVDVDVTNVGELASELVTVTLTAPEGTSWTLPASVQDWECTGEDRTATCTRDPLAPAGSDHLSLPLLGLPGGTGALGDVAVTATSPGADEGRTTMAVTGVPPVLTVVTDSATLPVQSDRRVQISFSVDVGPDVDAGAVGARILLPSSMQLDRDPPEAQTAGCTGSGQTIVCDLGDVPAGTSVPVLVSAVARSYADPEALIKVTAHAAKDVTSKTVQVRVPATYAGLSARFSERGSLGVTQVGAPLLSCARTGSATAACTTVLKGSGNNNNQSMVALDDAPPTGKRPAGSVSSSSRLDVPPGATIEWAGLYWSANKVASDGWSRDTTSAQLRPPGGTYDSVRDAKTITTQQDNAGRTYYESFADVTDQVRTGGPGLWSVADVAVATSRNDKDPSYFAGWALVVAYSTAGTAESTVTVYDGGVWVGTSASAPQFAFAAPTGSSATVGVVAWEGDAGTSGDQFRLGDRCTDSSTASTALTPTRANGAFGSASNAFDSTATGWLLADAASTKTPWSPPNSLGTDVKAFQRARLACDVSTLTATTTGDQYLIGAVTLLTEPTEVSPQTR